MQQASDINKPQNPPSQASLISPLILIQCRTTVAGLVLPVPVPAPLPVSAVLVPVPTASSSARLCDGRGRGLVCRPRPTAASSASTPRNLQHTPQPAPSVFQA
jgi:hypothetical protein